MKYNKEIPNEEKAEKILKKYVGIALATGAITVPAASLAIITENAAMITHLTNCFGKPMNVDAFIKALGVTSTLNIFGKTVFIEIVKIMGLSSGNAWATVALSGVGASTAALQTLIIGKLAIYMAKNGGEISQSSVSLLIEESKKIYKDYVKQ